MIHTTRESRRRLTRAIAVLALAGCAVAIVGCLKFPIGDPANSKIDPRILGYWLSGENSGDPDAKLELAMVTAFDEHAYVIQYATFKKTAAGVDRDPDLALKAWLSDVKGVPFLSLQKLTEPTPGDAPSETEYSVFKLQLTDGLLTCVPVNTEFPDVKLAKNSDDLAAIIAKNFDDPKLYDKPATFRKLTSAEPDKQLIKKIFGN